MKHIVLLGAALLTACAATPPPLPEPPFPPAGLDAEISRLMTDEDVKGLAVAIIDQGEPVYVDSFGYRNVERGEALETDTIMYGASLTKSAVAYTVLTLVDEGLMDLDTPLAEYLAKPLPDYEDWTDLADQPRWKTLTARHVLNHTTGFHNFRWLEDDKKLRFHRDPGTRYGYSGEGFYILQQAVEELTGEDLGKLMQARLFGPAKLTDTDMEWRDAFADKLADGYGWGGTFEPHDARSRPSAAGSMDTSIADQAKLWSWMVKGEGLSDEARREWTRQQFPITSAHQFPPQDPTDDPRTQDINLSAGLGLVTFTGPQGHTFFKGGHNPWTGNMVICVEASERCVVFLANSVRAERIYPDLAQFILGDTGMPWWWEYNGEHYKRTQD
ncbi:MAG: serine hydrolase [Hirschia sp.]|nr:serine hydrolase [Hirschia sp.]MBF17568.1 serine hydrolase [Hirschia sp.]